MKLFQWTVCLMTVGALASSTLAQTEPKPDAASPAAPRSSAAVVQDSETTPPPPAPAPPPAPVAPLPPPTAAQPAMIHPERYGLTNPKTSDMLKRYGLSTPPQRPPAPEAIGAPATEAVTDGIFEEEADQNPEAAIRSYQAVISGFDSQRANVANAIFRLGECYRKLGRMEEAKVQYARILREFTDMTPLVQSSQRHLATPTPRPRAGGYGFGGGVSIGSQEGGYGGGIGGRGDVIQPSSGVSESNPEGGTVFRDRLSQIVRRSTEDPFSKSAMLKRQLDQAQNEKMSAESKLMRIRTLLRMVQNSDPVNIPEKAAADPRYQELKKAYEKSVLDNNPANMEKERLSIWVKKIYLPEMEAAQKASDIEVNMYDDQFKELADALKTVQQEEEKQKQPGPGRF